LLRLESGALFSVKSRQRRALCDAGKTLRDLLRLVYVVHVYQSPHGKGPRAHSCVCSPCDFNWERNVNYRRLDPRFGPRHNVQKDVLDHYDDLCYKSSNLSSLFITIEAAPRKKPIVRFPVDAKCRSTRIREKHQSRGELAPCARV
jgi:hypothetical protein